MNGITLTGSEFDGKFFTNRQLTVEAQVADGQEVKGWKVIKTNSNGSTTEQDVFEPVYTFNMPSCKKLALRVITGTSDGICDLTTRNWNWLVNDNLLTLHGVDKGTAVMLYDVRGMVVKTVVADGADIRIPLSAKHQMYVLKVGKDTVKIQ